MLAVATPVFVSCFEKESGLSLRRCSFELSYHLGCRGCACRLCLFGRHLSQLPVEPRVGKLLVMGALFGCLSPVLTIASSMAHRDPFLMPLDKKEQVRSTDTHSSIAFLPDSVTLTG